ncbi:MAG: tRNA pseudouridine(55) synthase TruB [Clostridia bacterium]|nr:tRNA pseudouridine(55) synthase TruB [Clostridia bacterium]
MDGMINLYKPSNMTSHDVVKIVRRKFKKTKVGHTGTLDPMAIGVLPLCLGKATRITEYLTNNDKSYRCEMTLGIETDTQDIWGTILKEYVGEIVIYEQDVLNVFKTFLGEIEQIPPMYSAVRVQGKRLYQYARSGKEIEVKPRKIKIYDLYNIQIYQNKITFDVKCSKGTYIRTLCYDIGKKLGYGAALSYLERTSSGIFTKENAISVEDLDTLSPETYMIHMDAPLENMGAVDIKDEKGFRKVSNGCKLMEKEYTWKTQHNELTRIYYGKSFVAIGIYNTIDHSISMKKVFL